MFGDERATAKEICLLVMHASGLGSAVSEIKKMGMHVRTCSRPPPPKKKSDLWKVHHKMGL